MSKSTASERLAEIEEHFKKINNLVWPEDVRWLIARIKHLEDALKDIAATKDKDYTSNNLTAREALENDDE